MSGYDVDELVPEGDVLDEPAPRRRLRLGGRTVAALVLTAVGLAALTVAQVVVVAPRVETDLARDARVALRQAGVTTVDVRAEGRDLVVTGTVPDVKQASAVEQLVNDVDGVRYVDTTALKVGAGPAKTPGKTVTSTATAPGTPITTPTTTVVVVADQGRALVAGTLPRAAGRTLVAALRAVFGAGAVDVRYVVDEKAPSDGVEAVGETVAALGPQADAVAVTLSRGVMTVAASVTSRATEKAALAAAAKAVPGPTVDRVVVAGPVASADAVAAQLSSMPELTFGAAQTAPGPVGRSVLAAVAFVLEQRTRATVTLVGHTEDTGDPAVDTTTSLARARAAEQFLGTLGIPGSRVVTRGVGSTDPAVEGTSTDAVAANRRLVVSGG